MLCVPLTSHLFYPFSLLSLTLFLLLCSLFLTLYLSFSNSLTRFLFSVVPQSVSVSVSLSIDTTDSTCSSDSFALSHFKVLFPTFKYYFLMLLWTLRILTMQFKLSKYLKTRNFYHRIFDLRNYYALKTFNMIFSSFEKSFILELLAL